MTPQSVTKHDLMRAIPGASPHLIGEHSNVLSRIVNPGVNLCLWQRSARPAISRELLPLLAGHLPDVRSRTSLASFDQDVSTLLRQQGLDADAFTNWRSDLRRLAGLFFGVSQGRAVAMRLETTGEDGCPRFHVDRTHLRMLCSYRGPGTQWLSDAQVDRAAQGSGAANEDIVRFGEPSQFETFWVGILKGDAYPGNAGGGLVHRSPPIAGSGQTRVLFCLDC